MKNITQAEIIKNLNRSLKLKSVEIQKLKLKIIELEDDRSLFREHFVSRFQWWFRLLKDNQTPSLAWMAEQDAMWLRRFKWWSF